MSAKVLPCIICGEMPKYKYIGRYVGSGTPLVMQCSGCGASYHVCNSDLTALKYWNKENAQ